MKHFLLLGIIFLTLHSCNIEQSLPETETAALTNHYNKEEEKEKHQAAQYTETHYKDFTYYEGSIEEKYNPFFLFLDSLNKNGISKRVDRNSIKLTPEINNLWDSIQNTITAEEYNKGRNIKDHIKLPAEYYINNIDLAYKEWKTNKWSQHYSFNTFCEYILPYKVYNETPENWRSYFIKKYATLKDTTQSNNALFVANTINKDIEKWFKFSTLFYDYPFDMGLERLIQGQVGGCKHMVTTTVYANRALGIPCAVDYAPNYGNRSLGHNWLVVFDHNMNAVPYNGASTEWLEMGYVFHNQTADVKIPKIYRKMFSIQENIYDSLTNENDLIRQNFSDKHRKDVTAEYIPVSDITLDIPKRMPEDKKLAYLCIFNNKTWVPVEWGEIKDRKVTFENMGRDIVYLPIVYNGDKMVPFAEPLILNKEGIVVPIKKHKGKAQSAKLFYKYPPALTAVNDSTNAILHDNEYELFFWHRGWVSLGRKTTANRQADLDSLGFDFKRELFFADVYEREFIFYENVPVGALFLLRNHTQGKEERIFTLEDTKQVWW